MTVKPGAKAPGFLGTKIAKKPCKTPDFEV